MKSKKVIVYAIMLILVFSSFATPVYAATLSFGGAASATAGSYISISIVVGTGCQGAEGTISYDPGKLSYVSASPGSGWTANYADATKRFVVYRTNSDPAAGTTMTLKFQAKSGASGTTTISANSVIVDPAGTTSASKTITINQPTTPVVRSSDAALKSLAVAEGTLTPAFSTANTSYSLSVSPETEKITVNAVQNFAKASVSIGGYTLIQGETTPVSVVVTAENGSTKTYTIQVTRALPGDYVPSDNALLAGLAPSYGALSPAFDPNIFRYAIDVPYEATDMTFTAQTSFIRAKFNVLGTSALKPGVDNSFYVVVMAEDNKASQIYTITVRRSAVYSMYLQDDYVNDIINQITKQTMPVIMNLSSAPAQVVDSRIMTALKENPDRQLVIQGISSRVTIKGSDLKKDIKAGFYDFTINPSSQYKDEMTSKASDAQSFVFSTHHQGAWPGNVEYAIDTVFITGTDVNIYQYKPAKDQYITVAENVKVVGGTVAFAYDQGGDFIITTAKFSDAVSSGTKVDQPMTNQGNTMFYLIGMGLTLFPLGILAGVVGSRYWRKHRKKKAQVETTENRGEPSEN